MKTIFVENPSRRRRRRTTKSKRRTPPRTKSGQFRKRRKARRNPVATATNPRRRRRRASTPRRRTTVRRKRRYTRNPGGSMKLNIQDALLGAVGAAVAKAGVRQFEKMSGNVLDTRAKAAAVLAFGALLPMAKFIPAGYRRAMATGAQIAGATQLLADFAPDYFGGIMDVDPLAIQLPDFPSNYAGGGVGMVGAGGVDTWPENG